MSTPAEDLTSHRLTELEANTREMRADMKTLAASISELARAVAVLSERLPPAVAGSQPSNGVLAAAMAAISAIIVAAFEAIKALAH